MDSGKAAFVFRHVTNVITELIYTYLYLLIYSEGTTFIYIKYINYICLYMCACIRPKLIGESCEKGCLPKTNDLPHPVCSLAIAI